MKDSSSVKEIILEKSKIAVLIKKKSTEKSKNRYLHLWVVQQEEQSKSSVLQQDHNGKLFMFDRCFSSGHIFISVEEALGVASFYYITLFYHSRLVFLFFFFLFFFCFFLPFVIYLSRVSLSRSYDVSYTTQDDTILRRLTINASTFFFFLLLLLRIIRKQSVVSSGQFSVLFEVPKFE